MTQKWYLRNGLRSETFSAQMGNVGHSVTQPATATFVGLSQQPVTNGEGVVTGYLGPSAGTTASSLTITLQSSTNPQRACMGMWVSGPLGTVTLNSGGTWTIGIAAYESNVSANMALASASLYIWRPTTRSVVGFIIDGDADVGGERGTVNTTCGTVLTFNAANTVQVENGDRLVYEMWFRGTMTVASPYLLTLSYGGTTDVTNGSGTTQAATYLQAPVDIPTIGSPTNERWG